MKIKTICRLATTALVFALAASANATLIDRGNGLIYDSDQDITWLQDANYAMTSGYDTNGRMNWDDAITWVTNLSYGGYDDWRLPIITDNGNDGCNFSYDGTDCGYNVDTSGSELAYMWYNILGNTALYDTSGSYQPPGWGLSSTSADGVGFLNLMSYAHWSGVEFATNTDGAWGFQTGFGYQGGYLKSAEYYVWAVRSGDVIVAAVPEPVTLLLMFAGLVGVAGVRHRRNS
ncbi:MAG: PEP-CTERM sorting domain-containing protein [Idiomarina sp.]|nr:PEP-CTERM sorting domain-containing protein [Idiomarina sp.]